MKCSNKIFSHSAAAQVHAGVDKSNKVSHVKVSETATSDDGDKVDRLAAGFVASGLESGAGLASSCAGNFVTEGVSIT